MQVRPPCTAGDNMGHRLVPNRGCAFREHNPLDRWKRRGLQPGSEIHAVKNDSRWRLQVEQPQHGRRQVGEGGQLVGVAADADVRAGEDQRHQQTGVVSVVAMLEPEITLTEVLAVVGGEDHHRVRELAAGFEFVDHAADLVIGVGNLCVIEPSAGVVRGMGAIAWAKVVPEPPRRSIFGVSV